MRGPLTEIHRRLTDVLRNVTLAELFANPAVPIQALTILGLPMAATKA